MALQDGNSEITKISFFMNVRIFLARSILLSQNILEMCLASYHGSGSQSSVSYDAEARDHFQTNLCEIFLAQSGTGGVIPLSFVSIN